MTQLTQADIDQMIRDQYGINPEEALPSNPNIGATLQNNAIAAASTVAVMNSSLTTIYGIAWTNFTSGVAAGSVPDDMAHAPSPPKGYIAGKASDGWVYVLHGPDPVVPQPPLPQAPPPIPPLPVFIPNVGQGLAQPLGMNMAVGVPFTETYQGITMTFVPEVDDTPFGAVTVWRRTA